MRWIRDHWRFLAGGSAAAVVVLSLFGCGADGYVSERDLAEAEREANQRVEVAMQVAENAVAVYERLVEVREQQQQMIGMGLDVALVVAGAVPAAAGVGIPGLIIAGRQIRKSKAEGVRGVVNAIELGKQHDPVFAERFKGNAGQIIESSLKAYGLAEEVEKARGV